MNFLIIVLSGIVIGTLGSFHCLGMCGPLALALPTHELTQHHKRRAILNYNFGRITTYAMIGFACGFFGMSFSWFDLQQGLSIAAGIFILVIIYFQINRGGSNKFVNHYSSYIKNKLFRYLSNRKTLFSYFKIGIFNGLLPCGLVYTALAASLTTLSPVQGALLMSGFGLGTLPVMIAIMHFGSNISYVNRNKIKHISPYVAMAIGMLLILRGLDLGIPYLSPSIHHNKIECCHS